MNQKTERKFGVVPYSLTVSPIGLGCMELSITKELGSQHSTRISESRAIEFIVKAWSAGVRLFDTADIYGFTDKTHGFGHNELLIGKALKILSKNVNFKREELVVSTKIGIVFDPKFAINNSSEYINCAVEKSLERLGERTIDLLYIHRFDGAKYDLHTMMSTLKKLVEEKKIRCIGLSDVSLEVLIKAHSIHPITAVQLEFSPWHQTAEAKKIIKFCTENDIGIIISTPLGRGFFTANNAEFFTKLPKKDFRSIFPRLTTHLESNIEQRLNLEKIAQNYFNCTLAQLVLAWLLHQSPKIVPIPGTANFQHLMMNLEAQNIKFTEEQLNFVNNAINSINFVGENEASFAEAYEKMTGTAYFYTP